MSIRSITTVLPVALAGLALTGCAGPDGPTAPSPTGTATMTPLDVARAWPHENGTAYAYRYNVRMAVPPPENLYSDGADVPAVTLDQVAALLAAPPPFTSAQEETHGYVLAFLDSATAGNGMRGQNLVPTVTSYPIPRPEVAPPAAALGIAPDPPVFLGGGVWRLDSDRIVMYADVPAEVTWVFLAGALSDRTPWEVQVQPGLTQAFLRARAYQSASVDVAGFRTDDALDVHYLLDHGIEGVSQPGGGVLYRRRFSYARLIWAADAGPLYLYERRGMTAGDVPTPGVVESTLLLENVIRPVGHAHGSTAAR